MSAQPAGQQSTGPPLLDIGGPRNNVTDSMIVHDRSRMTVNAGQKQGQEPDVEHHLTLAGPMLTWDPLHIINILLGFVGSALATLGFFYPFWFSVYRQEADKETHYSLLASGACPSADQVTTMLKDPNSKVNVCYSDKSPYSLGSWVLGVQITGGLGMCLCIINLLMQLINFCMRPRKPALHNISLYVMAAGGFFLMIAGHIAHNIAVWQTEKSKGGSHLRVSPLGAGLFHVGTLFSSWVCVLTHVSSHAPGPLSEDTRFAHTYDKEEIAHPSSELLNKVDQLLLLEEDKSAHTGVPMDFRKGSIHSTEV